MPEEVAEDSLVWGAAVLHLAVAALLLGAKACRQATSSGRRLYWCVEYRVRRAQDGKEEPLCGMATLRRTIPSRRPRRVHEERPAGGAARLAEYRADLRPEMRITGPIAV